MLSESARALLIPGTGTVQATTRYEGLSMGTREEASGRIKEAAGAVLDDDSLKHEGKVDKVQGKAKDAIDSAADAVKDRLRKDDER